MAEEGLKNGQMKERAPLTLGAKALYLFFAVWIVLTGIFYFIRMSVAFYLSNQEAIDGLLQRLD